MSKRIAVFALMAVAVVGFVTGCEVLKGLQGEAGGGSSYKNPFEVTVGGQKITKYEAAHGVIANPVAGDAELVVDVKPTSDIIINVFECNNLKEGKVDNSVQGKVIIIKNKGTKVKLNDKLNDKAPLKAGSYLMNIVANGKTSRVCFAVK